MKKLKGKLILDAVLSVLLVAAMFMELTGVFLHEIIGFALFVGVLLHLVLERKWIAGTMRRMGKKGKMSKERIAKTAVSVLLIIAMVCMGVTSVLISTILRDAGLSLIPYSMHHLIVSVHTVSAYVICMLCVVHLAMHWSMVAGFFRIPYDRSRRAAIGTGVGALASLGVIALGVSAARAVDLVELATGEAISSGVDESGRGKKHRNGGRNIGSFEDGESFHRSPNGSGGNGRRSFSEDGSSDSSNASRNDSADSSSDGSEKSSSDSSNENASSPPSSTSSSGICTLCKKRCPLSDPRCNWPYEQGLI